MTSRDNNDVTDVDDISENREVGKSQECGDSLHERRRGEPAALLAVKPPTHTSDAEGSSPCTALPTPDDIWLEVLDPEAICDSILKRLRDKNDPLSKLSKDVAASAKNSAHSIDYLEKLIGLLDEIVTLKEHNNLVLRRLRDVNHMRRMYETRKQIEEETRRLKSEFKELETINEVLDVDIETDYKQGEILLEHVVYGGRVKRSSSRWKTHSRFGGSLLRKQRSKSAGGEDSDVPTTPLRRLSEGVTCKNVQKKKVSKWTKVKAAFRWEKAQWPPAVASMGGAAVAASNLVGAVALTGSSPSTSYVTDNVRDASLTPGSLISLTPNSSCEELRLDTGSCRKSGVIQCEDNFNFLQAPMQDDSSTSPSPNKLHKSAWGKMRNIIQRESVRKKSGRRFKSPSEVGSARRRSLSDGGDSDVPPALTLTIPSSEELESEPSHPVLRKQRSLELGAATRMPLQRPPRPSKWSKVKKAFLTSASVSVPSSPNRHSSFFTDAETEGLSSGCEASGVREEIARDYAALQSKLRREFSDRRGKLYAASRPVATEEQLSADFRKKLQEWQKMKGGGTTKQPPPVPARQDLSDDFLKRWDEWKRMKQTNSVPAWEEEAKPDEVLVQTSTGLFKFQGISRSFTRKLHEWEKSRGIKPEASTSALLQAARARGSRGAPPAPLTRTQSDGSVAPSATGSGRLHASSLSVNDAEDFDLHFEGDNNSDGEDAPGAVLVEVEAEEVYSTAPLVAVSPKHTPQKPIYTYGHAEARLLCETTSAITGTAVIQSNGTENNGVKVNNKGVTKSKTATREQSRATDRNRRKLARQPSLEEDAQFIRKTIEEIEKASTARYDENMDSELHEVMERNSESNYKEFASNSNIGLKNNSKCTKDGDIDLDTDEKFKDLEKNNGKKKSKSRARLEREQSKPSESDTELDVDTITVEIPKRRKRPRKISEKPRTPPVSLASDSEGEIFVLKLKAPERRDGSPEVIVKTTRKIFSPVVRCGETVPRAVIPVDVDDLVDVTPAIAQSSHHPINEFSRKRDDDDNKKKGRIKGDACDELCDGDEQRPRSRPPLPLSPSAQRRPQAKETAPSIRIMIQRYNMKIKEEEGHTSGASSGASSPAWRSPAMDRRRPLDMPAGVNIRNNPFLEREVQKSASACQLSSKRDKSSAEKKLDPILVINTLEGVLKSHSAGALHPLETKEASTTVFSTETHIDNSQDTIIYTGSTDTVIPDLTLNTPDVLNRRRDINLDNEACIRRQMSDTVVPNLSKIATDNTPTFFGRSASTVESPLSSLESDTVAIARCSERAKRIREAREKFLASPGPSRIRRNGTGSASDLRPRDRSSRISCESDVTEGSNGTRHTEEVSLGRSASTGMVNVEREAWERVTDEGRREARAPRSRFSLARLAAKLRRRDDGAVSRLCRQSLLVQLKNNTK